MHAPRRMHAPACTAGTHDSTEHANVQIRHARANVVPIGALDSVAFEIVDGSSHSMLGFANTDCQSCILDNGSTAHPPPPAD